MVDVGRHDPWGAGLRSATTKRGASPGIREGIVASGAVLLAVLGLAGVVPRAMLSLACMAIGVALLFEGGALGAHPTIATRASNRPSSPSKRGMPDDQRAMPATEVSGVVATLGIAGIAGIALGVLNLVRIADVALVSIAAMLYGAALVVSSPALTSPPSPSSGADFSESSMPSSTFTSGGAQVLAGATAMVLGVLALLGRAPYALDLAAMVVVAASAVVSGSTISGSTIGARASPSDVQGGAHGMHAGVPRS